jgi:outer membrane lipoprotein-sorting protein
MNVVRLCFAIAIGLALLGLPAAAQEAAPAPAEKKAGEEKKGEAPAGEEKKAAPEGEGKAEAKGEDAPLEPIADAETRRVMDLLDGAHKKITSFQADYEQIRKVKISRKPRKSKGTFYLRKSADGKSTDVLIVEREPFRSRALFTETEVALLDEESGEIRREDPRKGTVKPSEIWVMGRPSSEIRKYYDPKALPLEKGEEAFVAKLELTPRSEKVRKWVQRVIVWMRPEDGMGIRVRIVDKTGDYQEFIFDPEGLRINPELKGELFKIG